MVKKRRTSDRTSLYVLAAFVLAATEICMSLSSWNGSTLHSDRENDLDRRHLTAANSGPMTQGTVTIANQVVHFRDFTGNPKHHNSTVTGEAIPGAFFNDQLFFPGSSCSQRPSFPMILRSMSTFSDFQEIA
jgi:hypothetical protein